ncbi:hypothetical protein CC78DRAFT_563852 [Lojkania enalia]|uniref:F-box domain-containing protein n=1 Tax=Lojkania enalia TaxID=147567 RepID=A0A9P4TRD0_9PLEO|nr:hypothetical protein CC78DRAFT_563852 [Didymosphaeria enalia]
MGDQNHRLLNITYVIHSSGTLVDLGADTIAHQQNCTRHLSPLIPRCNALTRSKQLCSRAAKYFPPGHLPTCQQHASQRVRAGRCQATEKCGHMCLRIASYDPPYHLCLVHDGGKNDLPCYLLQIPTEIRLMIFRFLVPDYIPSCQYYPWKSQGLHASMLRVNRQLHTEFSSVLYGETPFHVSLSATCINFYGKEWCRGFTYASKNSNQIVGFDSHEVIAPLIARRVQQMEVDISINGLCLRSASTPKLALYGITREDFGLFEVRDVVQKFVQLFAQNHVCKKLLVKPAVLGNHDWELDEMVSAVTFATEPFKNLHLIQNPALAPAHLSSVGSPRYRCLVIGEKDSNTTTDDTTYREYQRVWSECLKSPTPSGASLRDWRIIEREHEEQVARTYLKNIEKFVALLYKQERVGKSQKIARRDWTDSAFHGIEGVLHIARVCSENADVSAMEKIRDAIKTRWVNYQRRFQNDSHTIARSIEDIGFAEDIEVLPRAEYPEAFEFSRKKLLTTPMKDGTWPELVFEDDAPKWNDPGVTYREDFERQYFRTETKEWARLKTPATVRAARALSPHIDLYSSKWFNVDRLHTSGNISLRYLEVGPLGFVTYKYYSNSQ